MNGLALNFIKLKEGCKLTSYKDQGGVWTIGYGSTGPDIVANTTWTQQQADARLASDIMKAEQQARKLVHKALSDTAFAPIISFVYNMGAGALEKSHLLQCINSGNYMEAANEWIRWSHVGSEEDKGLLIRRLEEAAMFLRGV